MVTRKQIITEARSWIDTPFHHQARKKHIGVDCAQLIIGVGQSLDLIGDYPNQYMNYGRTPRPTFMRERLREFMYEIPKEEADFGDVLWMGFKRGAPMHLGILSDLHGRGIIHAYSNAGRVVETVLNREFESMVHSWWRYRGIKQ